MELRHLRYFVAVAELQNITLAAARLHISQPPLSRQIRDLEEELGVKLLDRGARQVQLTKAGRLFLREARRVLAAAEQAVQRVRRLAQQPEETLRVGYAPTPTANLLPKALQVFQTLAPSVHPVLLDLSTDEMIEAVGDRSLDLAIFVRPLGQRWARLVFRKLFELPVGILVPPQHPFAQRPTISLQEALREPIVAYIRQGYSDYHAWLASVLKYCRTKPRILARADGSSSLVAAIAAGQGIAFGPPTFTVSFGTRIHYVPLSDPVPRLEVGVLTRREKPSPLRAAFQRALESALASPS